MPLARPSPRPSSLAPGERRSCRFALAWDLPVVEFGGGTTLVEALHARLGHDRAARAWDLGAAGRSPSAPAWRRRSRPGRRRSSTTRVARLVQVGALQRALLPRRRRDGLGSRARSAAPRAGMPDRRRAGSRSSSASTTRSTTRSTSTFYASFALLELWPELERAGSATSLGDGPDRRSGDRRRSRRPA